VSVNPNLITVAARVLPCPEVVYKGPKKVKMSPGSWNLVNQKFNVGSRLQRWSTLVLTMPSVHQDAFDINTESGQTALNNTLTRFTRVLRSTGLTVDTPRRGITIDVDNTEESGSDPYKARQAVIANEIEAALRKAAQDLDLVLVILPTKRMAIYHLVKRLGDVKYGITTVCTVGSLIAKNQDQYFNNVAMKVNLKLGGSNHFVARRHLGLIAHGKTMIVGVDVTHPSPDSHQSAPSIAGMVASINGSLGQWPGVLAIQARAGQEMITDLKDMMKSRLKLWKTKGGNKDLPENILAVRDGVSESQYRQVMEREVPLYRKAFDEVYSLEERKRGLPRLTVIIVGKRHNQRFYPTKGEEADASSNTKPGTVVDRGVTEARQWDFFLQAHAALKGTARPAHYHVIVDEIFRDYYRGNNLAPFNNVADAVEALTLGRSYTYGRATKGVSICTPAYYADILCERARCYLANIFTEPDTLSDAGRSVTGRSPSWSAQDVQINARLRDRMFYI
jgi:eukaryotic translation initiation factor 2C